MKMLIKAIHVKKTNTMLSIFQQFQQSRVINKYKKSMYNQILWKNRHPIVKINIQK